MKHVLLIALLTLAPALHAQTQDRIYRCGNEYTNKPVDAKACKLYENNNVSVVPGTKVQTPPASASAPRASGSAGQRVDAGDQRTRDADARAVLDTELRRANARLTELKAEYKDGQPDKQGSESSNYQKYLDRTAELKAAIARTESDIAGIQRELGRTSAPGASAAK